MPLTLDSTWSSFRFGQIAFGERVVDASGSPTFLFEADTTVSYDNYANPFDVDGINGVQPLDVLILINYINAPTNDPALPAPPAVPPPYYDVSDDGSVTALDVLMVINHINSHPAAAAEGEAPAVSGSSDSAPVRTHAEPNDLVFNDLVFAALGQDDRCGLDELVPFPASKFGLRRPRVGGAAIGR